jgi:hypothetical protein
MSICKICGHPDQQQVYFSHFDDNGNLVCQICSGAYGLIVRFKNNSQQSIKMLQGIVSQIEELKPNKKAKDISIVVKNVIELLQEGISS